MGRHQHPALMTDLLDQVRTLARQYRSSAGSVTDADTAALLRRFGHQRESLAARLAYQVQAMGDPPDTGDTDGQWVRESAGALRTRPPGNGALALQERAADEERLAALAAAALDQPLPEAVRRQLRVARDEARTLAGQLRRRAAGR